jgi:hypothetical protein
MLVKQKPCHCEVRGNRELAESPCKVIMSPCGCHAIARNDISCGF